MPVYFICLKHRAIERIELFRVELRGHSMPALKMAFACLVSP